MVMVGPEDLSVKVSKPCEDTLPLAVPEDAILYLFIRVVKIIIYDLKLGFNKEKKRH